MIVEHHERHYENAMKTSKAPNSGMVGYISTAHHKVSRIYVLRKMVQEREEIFSAWLRWEDQDWLYYKNKVQKNENALY